MHSVHSSSHMTWKTWVFFCWRRATIWIKETFHNLLRVTQFSLLYPRESFHRIISLPSSPESPSWIIFLIYVFELRLYFLKKASQNYVSEHILFHASSVNDLTLACLSLWDGTFTCDLLYCTVIPGGRNNLIRAFIPSSSSLSDTVPTRHQYIHVLPTQRFSKYPLCMISNFSSEVFFQRLKSTRAFSAARLGFSGGQMVMHACSPSC